MHRAKSVFQSEEAFQIMSEVIEICNKKYGKKPPKKKLIMEILNYQGGTITMKLLSEVMDYSSYELEKWVLRLNKEHKINIEGDYGHWTIVRLGDDISINSSEYKSIGELRTAISNFNRESSISGGERAILNALVKLSDDYAWKVYVSIYEFIDKFLW